MIKYALLASVASAALAVATGAQAASSLGGQNFNDIGRTTATSVEQANKLRSTVTPAAVAQLMPNLVVAPSDPLDTYMAWHLTALNVTAVDHTSSPQPTYPGAPVQQVHFEQFGPHRTSRAMAIVHTAMFEVANAFAPAGSKYQSYVNQVTKKPTIGAPPAGASEAAAIIEAAYNTLVSLYSGQATNLKGIHDQAIAALGPTVPSTIAGQAYGVSVANAVLALRASDNANSSQNVPEPTYGVDFTPKNPPGTPGQWEPDPVSNLQVALGANWPTVTPWIIPSANYFRTNKGYIPGPPDVNSQAFQDAFNEVAAYGGDPRLNIPRTDPNPNDYFIGKFWSYDATSGLCAPVRLYEQIADEVLSEYSSTIAPHINTPPEHVAAASEVAHYYGVINIALADAAIAAWEGKYYYQFWRPVQGIRAAQVAANPAGSHIELWYPLSGQNTNGQTPYNVTPPFPAYPSGHGTFGGALFEILRKFVPSDHGFSFQSDEFNGPARPKAADGTQQPNIDAYNFIRCQDGDVSPIYCKPLKFVSFSDAESQNTLSRIYLGVHWHTDATDAAPLGEAIGDYVYAHVLQKQ